MNKEKILELAKDCGIDWFPQAEVTENQLEVFAAVIEHELLGDSKPVAWMYTLEYGSTIARTVVSQRPLNYPFGVCGSDYLRSIDDEISYVRQTPLYINHDPAVAAQLVDALVNAEDLIARYLDTFAKLGDKMPYGHRVLSEVQLALAAANEVGYE